MKGYLHGWGNIRVRWRSLSRPKNTAAGVSKDLRGQRRNREGRGKGSRGSAPGMDIQSLRETQTKGAGVMEAELSKVPGRGGRKTQTRGANTKNVGIMRRTRHQTGLKKSCQTRGEHRPEPPAEPKAPQREQHTTKAGTGTQRNSRTEGEHGSPATTRTRTAPDEGGPCTAGGEGVRAEADEAGIVRKEAHDDRPKGVWKREIRTRGRGVERGDDGAMDVGRQGPRRPGEGAGQRGWRALTPRAEKGRLPIATTRRSTKTDRGRGPERRIEQGATDDFSTRENEPEENTGAPAGNPQKGGTQSLGHRGQRETTRLLPVRKELEMRAEVQPSDEARVETIGSVCEPGPQSSARQYTVAKAPTRTDWLRRLESGVAGLNDALGPRKAGGGAPPEKVGSARKAYRRRQKMPSKPEKPAQHERGDTQCAGSQRAQPGRAARPAGRRERQGTGARNSERTARTRLRRAPGRNGERAPNSPADGESHPRAQRRESASGRP
ncbi:hypothetical protein GOBAR_AA07025 [Gossypium barbadense]|uniref:Uncharacterized protein n=1 Tax=Gossypium barbadense TaxID=3634 RepID=A0A2P5YDD8_GOSBA|nr:hypothetical protein GOBAR_AA07025 [Gossypium barbadense]